MLTALLLFGLVSWTSSSDALVHLTAKQIHRGKVFGVGYSVSAKNLPACMQACNLHNTTCDGVVFHQIIRKCRLLKKCAVAVVMDNSTSAVYYSKRPQLPSEGYLYLEASDSCLGLQQPAADYAQSDNICQQSGGKLAILETNRARNAADKILKKSKMEWAWIGEVEPGNRVGGRDMTVTETSVTPSKSCWALANNGTLAQFSCKHHAIPALCQILPYPA